MPRATHRRPNFIVHAEDPADAAPLVRTRNGRRTLEFAPGDIQSEMLLARPDALVLDYTRAMMCFALFVPRPRHILMVGLGGGSILKFCHRHFPDCRITVVELRADVIALRGQFGIPPDDARLRVIHGDAVDHVRLLAARADIPPYDVLLVDGFGADGLPPSLAGAAFYRDCRAVLADGGVLVANVFTYDPRYPEVLDALDTVFAGRSCWFDKVAGNNRIVYALNAPGEAGSGAVPALPARRLREALARRRGLGLGWLNRLAVRLVVAWLARRTVPNPPRSLSHAPPPTPKM